MYRWFSMLFLLPALAHAAWGVDHLHLQINAKQRSAKVSLISQGAGTHYIQVALYQLSIKHNQEQLTPIKLGQAAPVKITPSRLILRGNSRRVVKVHYVGNISKQQEHLYQIRFLEAEKPTIASITNNHLQGQVSIEDGYGVYLMIQPLQLMPKLSYQRAQQKISVTNTGNVTTQVYLMDKSCHQGDKHCLPLINFISFPGRTDSFKVPHNHQLNIAYRLAGKVTWLLK